MPNLEQYDMEFRPKSYWVYDDPKKKVRATVKGTVRRAVAEAAIDGDPVGLTDPHCFDELLSSAERDLRGSFHPMLMGGEYLPDLGAGEVEIARVEYQSVTGDVVSVRARWEQGAIHYRVADEYENAFTVEPASSARPLSMGEIVKLIDTADIVMAVVLMNHEYGTGDPEDVRDFATVSSAFYPELGGWYADMVDAWADAIIEERRRENEEHEREEKIAAEEYARQRQVEDDLISASPGKSPWEFPPDLPTDRLTRVDIALLNKWIAKRVTLQPASFSTDPPRALMGGMSKERYLYFDWQMAGEKKTCRLGRCSGCECPTMAEVIRRLTAEVQGFEEV